MEKINFIKTFIPEGRYRQKYEYGDMVVYHINAKYNKEMNAYECYECTLPKATFDEAKVRAAFTQFSAKLDALKLEQAKSEKIAEITAYDKSSAVNSFLLNDKKRWLDIDLRRSLSYSTNILKENGEKTVDIWFDTECETMNIDNALYMLKELEVYAKQTNNVTHQHKEEVMALTSIEEVEAYDITKGYPEKLVFSF
jgi:hypothetical protein